MSFFSTFDRAINKFYDFREVFIDNLDRLEAAELWCLKLAESNPDPQFQEYVKSLLHKRPPRDVTLSPKIDCEEIISNFLQLNFPKISFVVKKEKNIEFNTLFIHNYSLTVFPKTHSVYYRHVICSFSFQSKGYPARFSFNEEICIKHNQGDLQDYLNKLFTDASIISLLQSLSNK